MASGTNPYDGAVCEVVSKDANFANEYTIKYRGSKGKGATFHCRIYDTDHDFQVGDKFVLNDTLIFQIITNYDRITLISRAADSSTEASGTPTQDAAAEGADSQPTTSERPVTTGESSGPVAV